MKNTRTAKHTRSNISIVILTLVIATTTLLFICSQDRDKVEQIDQVEETQKIEVIYHDKISKEEIQATVDWLNKREENLKCNSKCIDNGELIEIPEEQPKKHDKYDDDYTLLCKVVFAEASRQSEDEMIAIAATILNRVEDSEFPNSIYEVAFEKGQFSTAKDGNIWWFPEANKKDTVKDSDITDEVKSAVNKALLGEDPTEIIVTDGAIYFFSDRYISEEEMQKRTNIGEYIKIGDTVFYREWKN